MFQGADTDQLRSVAASLDSSARAVGDLLLNTRSAGKALTWDGTDADRFHEQLDGVALSAGRQLQELLALLSSDLVGQASQQDETSATLLGSASGLGLVSFPVGRWPEEGFDALWPMLTDDLDGIEVPLWGDEREAALSTWGSEGATSLGALTLAGTGSAALLSARAGGSAGATFDKNGARASVRGNAGAYLATAEASGRATFGLAEARGDVRAFAGAEADVKGDVFAGPSGIGASAGGSAFAGAKATAEGSLDVAGVGGSARGELWAGIGAEASADVVVSAEQVKISVSAGAALGLGGSVEFEIDVNPKEVVTNVGRFLNPFD
jgi:hypothetical protein